MAAAAAARGRTADHEEQEAAKVRVVTLAAHTTRGGAPAKTLATRWLAFVEAAQNGSSQAAEEAHARFLVALFDMTLAMQKLAAARDASRRELEGYERKQQELADNIEQARAAIEAKKRELEEARLWRQQQEEYEVLRKQIIEVQPRHETQQQIDAVEREIASIQADIVAQETTYQVVAKKCAAVRHQLEDLLASFPRGIAGGGGGADAAAPMQVDG